MDGSETRSTAGPAEAPAAPTPRRGMTIRSLMFLVVTVALFCAQRVHLNRWEARRAEMGLRRDVTQSVIREAMADLSTLDQGHPGGVNVTSGPGNGTREWSIEVRKLGPDGRLGPARARVSGGNGEFALKPITVEVSDPLLRGPWLERLLRAYRERGWPHEVMRPRE